MFETKRKKIESAYRSVFRTHEGKTVLADLCVRCHLGETFDTTTHDGILLSEGRRQVMLYVLSRIGVGRKDIEKISEHIDQAANLLGDLD